MFQLMEQMMEKEVTMMVKVMVAEGQLAAATHHACTVHSPPVHLHQACHKNKRCPGIQQLRACTATLMPAYVYTMSAASTHCADAHALES